MFGFYHLNKKIYKYLSKKEHDIIVEAYLFGANAHEEQVRTSKEPYFSHPIAVANILANLKMDSDTIIGGLLHDTIEDCEITYSDIQIKFGKDVSNLVEGVTKLAQFKFRSKEEAQAESFRKMMIAMAKDTRVIIIKLADRLHNMSTLAPLKPEKRRRVAKETLEIYSPIAHRLGIHDFKNKFDDLAFEAMYPYRSSVLNKRISEARGSRKRLMEKIEKKITNHLSIDNIKKENIQGREKKLYNIYQKMMKKNIALSEIMDIYAYRIIVNTPRDCYNILGAVHELYKPVAKRFKDYIAKPKANGYQSLHTVLIGPYGILIEIQIRTQKMHDWAENGIAAHWIYKSNMENDIATKWFDKLNISDKDNVDSLDFIQDAKIDIFSNEIYVFKADGSIMDLPEGSTIIDFAYILHSEIGSHCISASVNRKNVPLNYKLSNGERVEILTSPTALPDESWLNFVFTNRAKTAIKRFFSQKNKDDKVLFGKKLFTQGLSIYKISEKNLSKETITLILNNFQINNLYDLYLEIANNNINYKNVAQYVAKILNTELSSDEILFTIPIIADSSIVFSECCRPILGDRIVGIMSKNNKLHIHTLKCNEIMKTKSLALNTDIIIQTGWPKISQQLFKVDLTLNVLNFTGAIANIARIISYRKASIYQIKVNESIADSGIIYMQIAVENRTHLASIIKRLYQSHTVYKVVRGKIL